MLRVRGRKASFKERKESCVRIIGQSAVGGLKMTWDIAQKKRARHLKKEGNNHSIAGEF